VMMDRPPWSYVPCVSATVPGCLAVATNIGERMVEHVRVQMRLEDLGQGRYTVTYQLGDDQDDMAGACL
jgi:hypothetical protein